MEREPKKALAVVDWYRKLYGAFRGNYLIQKRGEKQLSDQRKDLLVRLAGYLRLIGPTEDRDAQKLFKTFCLLFLHQDRTSRWNEAVDLFPADPQRLLAFSYLIQEYEKIAASGQVYSLGNRQTKINLATVIEYALKGSKHPDIFLNVIREAWYKSPAKIFSELFIREAAKSHKGIFGGYADEYHFDSNELNIIS